MREKKPTIKEVGERLQKLQYEKMYSTKQMYEALKIAKGTYSRYINAEAAFDYTIIEKLISIFNCNPLWLITGDGEMFIKDPGEAEAEMDLVKSLLKNRELAEMNRKVISALSDEYKKFQSEHKYAELQIQKITTLLLSLREALSKQGIDVSTFDEFGPNIES